MSCILKDVASIHGLQDLLTWICPDVCSTSNSTASNSCSTSLSSASEKVDLEEDTWPDWDESPVSAPASKTHYNHDWLDKCLVAVSPMVDLMVIAYRNRLAFLTSRWERNVHGEKKSIFSICWKGTIGHLSGGDEITSVVCMPIISQKQSSSGAPDWISIIVGCKSGFISFYTENGVVLLSQIFEESPVVDMSVRTYVPKNFGACVYADLSEELLVLYAKSAVSIDGFSLLQTLKACRNHAAKAAAIGGDCENVTTLGYKKWRLSEQEEVCGCVGTGMVPPHLYDYVVLMSNLRGFSQELRGNIPTTSLLLTVGKNPFFASYSIKESLTQPLIADIALHYASKLKNAFFSAASVWPFGSRGQAEVPKKEKRKIEQAVSIPFRYILPDKRRKGLSIQLSNSRRLATVTDDFGRVNVIDVQKNCVVRMFKGYRDAECGWVTVYGDLGEAQREVPFLVIHAPRRNLLEVWLPQQGPRVAAFNVPKDTRLIYTPHSLLGAHTQQGRLFPTTPVVLLNSQGEVERVSIPFHLALSGKTSKQAKDAHLLKTLKTTIRNKPLDQVLSLVQEIQTTPAKIQLLSFIVGFKYLTVELAAAILEQLRSDDVSVSEERRAEQEKESRRTDHENRLLSHQMSRLSQLLRLYYFVSSLHSDSIGVTEEIINSDVSKCLKLSAEETARLLAILNDKKLQPVKTKKVTLPSQGLKFSSFVQCWEICSSVCFDKAFDDVLPVAMSSKSSEDSQTELGQFLFGWPYNTSRMRDFGESLQRSGLRVDDVIRLCFLYWSSIERLDKATTMQFFHYIFLLFIFNEPHLIISENLSEVKPLWEGVRERVAEWKKPLHAYVAAVVCRGVESNILFHANRVLKELNQQTDSEPVPPKPLLVFEKLLKSVKNNSGKYETTLDNSREKIIDNSPEILDNSPEIVDNCEGWEEFSLEIVEWNLLIKNLEKLVCVQRFYNVLTNRDGAEKLFEPPDYSLKVVTLKGKGYLSELIAKWFIHSKINIEKVIAIIKKLDKEGKCGIETEVKNENEENLELENEFMNTENVDEELSTIEEEFKCMKENFPESSKCDVLLVNLSWEFIAAWKKSPNYISSYKNSIQALKCISSAFYKHGLSYMMWETWVVHYVQSIAQLMEKVARRPKDRIVLKDIGISEFNLNAFFTLTRELLECMMEGQVACEVERAPVVEKDSFWKDVEVGPSLSEVTVAQKMTSSDLTFLHHQLIRVLELIVKYELKGIKPFSLFPERDRAALFKPLISSWRSTSDEGREVVSSNQLTFLSRVVSAAVINLPDAKMDAFETPSGLNEAVELGRSWGVSLDVIRRQYVCELYGSGLDAMAEQALIIVRDGVMIASQMVVIAGQRLRHLITTSPKSMEVMALITPSLKEWCKSCDPAGLRCPDVPVRLTLKMAKRAMLLIPESSREYKVALNLVTGLDMIYNSNLFVES